MFKPMLAPNEKASFEPTDNKKKYYMGNVKFPALSSNKLDGIRCLFIDGEILSRSLKPIVNSQLREKFEPLAKYSKEHNIILDGEIYCDEIPFNLISSCVMTQDVNDKKAITKWTELCEDYDVSVSRVDAMSHLKFHCFDVVSQGNLEESFIDRIKELEKILKLYPSLMAMVKQVLSTDLTDIKNHFERALESGQEGLIIKSLEGKYKCGRGTIKEGLIYKVKPFVDIDAVIVGVKQGTKVDPNAEKKVNELGRSVTSKKKGDRILVEMVSDFYVDYEGHELKVSCSSMSHKDREKYWKIKDELIGKMIEYKGMLIGSKDVPRHPVFLRFREDKDE
jgi:DNA ligase-1